MVHCEGKIMVSFIFIRQVTSAWRKSLRESSPNCAKDIAWDYAGRSLCKFIFLLSDGRKNIISLNSLVYSQENRFDKLNK